MSSTAHAVGFSFVERLAQDLRDERLELPAFPEAVLRIQRALQSPDTSTDDIVRILSSEPALAARLLRMANSAEFRRADQNVTDLRKAVARMGFNMVRSVSVAFAMRQLRKKDAYTPVAQEQLELAWEQSLAVSATAFVVAKRFTRLNPDQALLAGLLHVLGRLYIIMRAKDSPELSQTEMREILDGWHATIGKAILETWGLPETLQHAVEHQDEYGEAQEAEPSLTDVLIAAKLIARGETEGAGFPAFARLKMLGIDGKVQGLEAFAEELRSLRTALSE
jgi:HD-like signal output (HDOD) protein